MRPTNPSAVSTGRLVRTPSRAPRSICKLRHQLAGSRAMTRASLTFHRVCRCQPTAARKRAFSLQRLASCCKLDFQLLVFAAELLDLAEQLAFGSQSFSGLAEPFVRGTGQAEERQKKSADGQLDLAHGSAGQLEQHQHQQDHHDQNYIMRLFQHLAPSAPCRRGAS